MKDDNKESGLSGEDIEKMREELGIEPDAFDPFDEVPAADVQIGDPSNKSDDKSLEELIYKPLSKDQGIKGKGNIVFNEMEDFYAAKNISKDKYLDSEKDDMKKKKGWKYAAAAAAGALFYIFSGSVQPSYAETQNQTVKSDKENTPYNSSVLENKVSRDWSTFDLRSKEAEDLSMEERQVYFLYYMHEHNHEIAKINAAEYLEKQLEKYNHPYLKNKYPKKDKPDDDSDDKSDDDPAGAACLV